MFKQERLPSWVSMCHEVAQTKRGLHQWVDLDQDQWAELSVLDLDQWAELRVLDQDQWAEFIVLLLHVAY